MFANTQRRGRIVGGLAIAAVAALALSACSGGGDTGDGGDSGDGASTLTMWSRAATQIQSQAFVDTYNAKGGDQIELTIIPTDDYQAKVGAAAGSKSLPDLFASDVVFVPNYTSQGLYLDITDRIDALPFAADLAQSHIETGTWEGAKYVVPHTMDLSVLFYNKDLYTQAGLDPEKPPTTLAEFDEQARAVDALGGDISGTYFGGNCGGCMVFTGFPWIWGAGGEVMNDEGTESLLASDDAKEFYSVYRGLAADGIAGPGTPDETGATWVAPFPEGTIGVMPMPSTMLGSMPENTGVAPIPGIDGGESTFVGGDAIGISATSKNADAAWKFLEWTLGDEAQIDVLAKNNDVVARTDLAVNEYSEKDPRVVTINEVAGKGKTPYSLNFGAAFNDPNGPWLVLFRNAVLGDGSSIDADNEALTAVLGG
ncbi:ABC transporter substrate-binding protein [Agromyces atrinae]|uniref:Multiple sugar transport system substrate-binding protein n=1 Tax=Agromyces atrinae TaxID=592376 RepID=A0A4Q2M1I6_9MICO|nr:sugar ABC transporter substrate-binding protein [Agromyces atrinae]NYD68367.1 multiple sugar transport system substrate-binding protein [Agromyces atrinae]RXZ85589.1 sugar ABC transporter substrate-binding protein [Agromyces atrinae]